MPKHTHEHKNIRYSGERLFTTRAGKDVYLADPPQAGYVEIDPEPVMREPALRGLGDIPIRMSLTDGVPIPREAPPDLQIPEQ